MSKDQIRPEDVRGRSRAQKLAVSDPNEATKVAKEIRHPWYRCQALTSVAEATQSINVRRSLLEEALKSAQELDEVNRAVTVSAWPIRVLKEISPVETIKILRELVHQANTEPHSLRRADALSSLLFAVASNRPLAQEVVPALEAALLHGHGWRIERVIADTIDLIEKDFPEVVPRLIAHHSENSRKRKLLKRHEV